MENLLVPFQAVAHIPCTHVLVLAPHPDDEVFGCGGAIMRHVENGEAVKVIIVTDGAFDNAGETRDYIRQRQLESKRAAAIIGYGTPDFWDYPDRSLQYGEKLVGEIIAVIEVYCADLIYAPSVFEMHPDHRVLGMAAMEAVRRLGGSLRLAAYEIGIPLTPNLLLDISDLSERKQAAMQCFVSQNEKQRYDLDIAALNRYRTYTLPSTVTAAEAYILVTAKELLGDPFRLYQSEHARQRILGLPIERCDFPLVSVIIRSMDRPTLSTALDSVALQTYPNIEVILVNSKGETHQLLEPWCGRFPLSIVGGNQPLNRSKAANAGLKAARGELLIFLDDDDWFLPHHIARLKMELDHFEHLVAAYSAVSCVDESGQEIKCFAEHFNSIKLRIDNYIPINAVLFKRWVIDQGSYFDEALEVCEDWDFWLQLIEEGDFHFVDKVGAVYRIEQVNGSKIWRDADLTRAVITSIYLKWMPRWNGETLWALMDCARNSEVVKIREQELLDLRRQLEAVYQTLGSRDQKLENSHKQIGIYQQSLFEQEKLLSSFLNSKSWKLTKPLRIIRRSIGKILKKYRHISD